MYEMCKKFSLTFISVLLAAVMALLLLFDNIGMSYKAADFQLTDLPASALSDKKRYFEVTKTCLLLNDSSQESNDIFFEHLNDVLSDMRVGFTSVDISKESVPDFSEYKTAVISFQNLDRLGEKVFELCNWVQSGGRCMFFITPEVTSVFRYLSRYLGIVDGAVSYAEIRGLRIKDEFMIGGKDFNFHWGDPMLTALSVRLSDNAQVHITSDDESANPLLWSIDCGKGRWVVNNHGLAEKATRGLTAASYALLEDICVYPVINTSAFFLDDFPSPVPMGNGTYIKRDYNRDISSFYSNVWWPDMLKLCENYGIKYTGLLIEDYSDETDGVFPRQTDTERFKHFGSLLLKYGGEIGLHGYNHQPLCFSGFDFKELVDYNTWKSEKDAVTAISEALDYTTTLFPEVNQAVYVPPSNILSDEGRRLLKEKIPQIKVIASLYLEGEIEYSQEFCVAEDGMIEFPRVISGAVLDQYMRWDALNALTLYFVNSHFMHPDDVLDEDRGAKDGWAALYKNLTDYCEWLYTSAPNIRNLTGSDSGRATARYDSVSFERADGENTVTLSLSGFWDEAYFMVRFNGRAPLKVTGGSIERVYGDFYTLRADSERVTIELERG